MRNLFFSVPVLLIGMILLPGCTSPAEHSAAGAKLSQENIIQGRPDLHGILLRVFDNKIIIGTPPKDRPKAFEGKSREEIRTYLHGLNDEEREAMRNRMLENISEEVEVPFFAETKFYTGRPRGDFTEIERKDLRPNSRVAVWFNDQETAETIFIHPFFKPQP